MDEEPPAFLAYQPYKGPASIPHAPADFFGAFFLATNVRDFRSRAPSAQGRERGGWGICPLRRPPPTHAHHVFPPTTAPQQQQSAMLWHMFPGKFLGTEVRARRHE
jgi:hypothetical protein